MKKIHFILLWLLLIGIFFSPVLRKKIPAPLDTIVGLYHPFRDMYAITFPNGIPFKNFLITDPVRQQLPYKTLSILSIKKGLLSAWNPYSFSGTPLSANIQSGYYYPLNIIFFIFPFITAWSMLIILAPLLAGIFIFNYLKFFELKTESCFLGALAFSFSGFFIAWMEWGTLTNVILWLPLILLSKEKILRKITVKWLLILIFAESSQLLAGHLQVSLYVLIFSSVYLLVRIFQLSYNKKSLLFLKNFFVRLIPFITVGILVVILVLIQYYSLLSLIKLSARNFDLPYGGYNQWFLPLKQIIQFIVPDFYGNPATLNYWGEWNYGEFIGYIGFIPLIFSIFAIFFRRDKKTLFFSLSVFLILSLILRNPFSQLPFVFKIPLLSTAQPTRLISLLVFSLSVLSALGFDYYLKNKNNMFVFLFKIFLLILLTLWLIVLSSKLLFPESTLNLLTITSRNLIIPSVIAVVSLISLQLFKNTKKYIIIYLFLVLTIFDLFRFGRKFLSFSDVSWFYPLSETISFLQKQPKPFRIMTMDRRILPPNFSIMYKLEDVSGYDPLYLLNYARLMQSWTSNTPEVNPGSFNRILSPQNIDSFIPDLLNVRYVLSLTDLKSAKLRLVFKEGETRTYENINVFPRVFIPSQVVKLSSDSDVMKAMFNDKSNLKSNAYTTENIDIKPNQLKDFEKVDIISRDENSLTLRSITDQERLIEISEIYYPGWKVKIDGIVNKIYPINIALRGVLVPSGTHEIKLFYNDLPFFY